MTESSYKVVEIIGSSEESWERAAEVAIEKAGAHLEDLRVAQVITQDIRIEKGKKPAFRTKLSLSFRFHDPAELHK